MGFWKTVEDVFLGVEKDKLQQPDLTEVCTKKRAAEAQLNKTIKDHDEFVRKMNTISEPVLSIIQTLKNGEWSFEHKGITYNCEIVIFTHQWFGNTLEMQIQNTWLVPTASIWNENWMTVAEKEAVKEICYIIYQGRVNWEKEQSLAKQRESFMCLVK